ncbi:MAG TPA: AMP-binding protein [Steroidobacteraceae bacterium]|nr:AMP-binding protein [Steroidobacteraceae bacterium]
MRTARDIIERNARDFPDREAYVCGGRRLSHAQWFDRAKRLAGGLYSLGLRRQDRVAIFAMNCLEFYETYAAAEVASFVCTPINYRLAAAEVAFMMRDCGAKILIFEAQYAPMVERLRSELRDVRQYICIGAGPDWATEFEALVALGTAEGPPIEPRSDDYVALWYTSGTTGRPKGVPWRQESVWETARANVLATELTGDSRVLQVTPLYHIGGKGYALGAGWVGGTVVLHRAFSPVDMLETIQRERITMTFMVAAMLQAVLEVPHLRDYDLSSIRMIVTAAAPIPVPLLRRAIELLGPVFSIQYGCTELGGISTLPRHEVNPAGSADDLRRLGSVGHVNRDVEVRLVNDRGAVCSAGEPGEVTVRSAAALDSYWNNTPATIESIQEGWYATGDIGVMDERGFLFLIDRKKDMIISGGENIYCREVEEAIARHPDVLDAAVIGVPDPRWVEAVKAVVVRKAGSTLDSDGLILHCRDRIASYKCPKSVDFVAELPRLPTGKLDKPALRARYRP